MKSFPSVSPVPSVEIKFLAREVGLPFLAARIFPKFKLPTWNPLQYLRHPHPQVAPKMPPNSPPKIFETLPHFIFVLFLRAYFKWSFNWLHLNPICNVKSYIVCKIFYGYYGILLVVIHYSYECFDNWKPAIYEGLFFLCKIKCYFKIIISQYINKSLIVNCWQRSSEGKDTGIYFTTAGQWK